MKKGITAFLSMIMVFAFFSLAVAELISPSVEIEDFTFHKGLRFGMSREEAIQFEKDTNETDFWGYNKYYDLKGEWGETKLADNYVDIFMSFDEDDKLGSVVFEKNKMGKRTFYDEINETLSSKYGNNLALSGQYIKLPTKGKNAIDYINCKGFYTDYDSKRDLDVERYPKLSFDDYKQYVVQVDDGYVEIFTVLYSYTEDTLYGPWDCYGMVVSYSFVDKQEYIDMIDESYKKQKEEEESRNADL